MLKGLRVSEVLGLVAADVGEARGQVVVRAQRKGGAQADIPLAPTAAALEQLLAETAPGAPLFVDAAGAPLDRCDSARIVRCLARRADIPHAVTPHSLRHTFVTTALLSRGTEDGVGGVAVERVPAES